MHASSLENMQKCYERYICGAYLQNKQKLLVLDIGGADVNGTYADIFSQDKFNYVTADPSPSKGVNVVLDDPYKLPFDDASVDILISGQTLEHVELFWLFFEEMVRVLKTDGWLFLIVPSAGPLHRYPVDCYRFYPDAYHALARYTGIRLIDVFRDQRGPWQDLVGVFSKSKTPIKPDYSKWKALPDSEINCYLADRLPAIITIKHQSDEIEKISGKSYYLETLKFLHQKLKPVSYVEIGIRKGRSLSLAQCPAIAIDPKPDIDMSQFNQVELYEMPSDHFFEFYAHVLEQKPVHLAFIDGMHLFEFVLRDFIHIEAYSCASTVIVIDDIFPNHALQASRKRISQVWTGDVWKMLLCLKKYRPDLNLMMLDCIPTGLLIITGLNRQNKVLVDQYNYIVREFDNVLIDDYYQLIIKRSEAEEPTGVRIEAFLTAFPEQKKEMAHNFDVLKCKEMKESKPELSVVINFYNMQREARRTLYSLTTRYQRDIRAGCYEVIVIDNGSLKKLDEGWVQSLGDNFRYIYFDAKFPSPCAALNYGINQARSSKVMCCIDGARILSPGILKYTLLAFGLHENPFIYTLGMHLGPKLQNYSIEEGYNQQVEDELLSTVDWKNNGYELFKISTLAASSKNGYFSPIAESNCFSMRKDDFLDIGGFDERFTSAGGGLVNLDIFNKAHEVPRLSPIMLLGEATFHQVHGGVATNVPMEQHPIIEMNKEYSDIRGKVFKSIARVPDYYGSLSKEYHEKLF